VRRFRSLQRTVFQNPASYFHHYRDLSEDEAREVALGIWRDIKPAEPAREHPAHPRAANVVLRKRGDHTVGEIWLRQI